MTIHPDIAKLQFNLFESYRDENEPIDLGDANEMDAKAPGGNAETHRAAMIAQLDAATKEGHEIIQRLVNDMQKWENTYHEVGSSDTASRETFALNIAYVLGLKDYR